MEFISPQKDVANDSNETPHDAYDSRRHLGYAMVDGYMHNTTSSDQAGGETNRNTSDVISREIPGMPTGLFNAGVWEHTTLDEADNEEHLTLLLGRLPQEAGAPGEGDPGPIVLSVIKDGSVQSTTELWRPEADNRKGDQLEDPRVIETDEGLFIGFTRLVYDERDQRHHPFPAIAFTTTVELLAGKFPDTYLITSLGEGDETTPLEGQPSEPFLLYGKNATPFPTPHKVNKFLFRQESYNHKLTLVSLGKNNIPKLEQNVDFPEEQIPWWAKDKMGTTMPPIWLNDSEALFMIHGFTIVNGRPNYAVGTARLFLREDKYYIDNISPNPLLTPQGLTNELFPGQQLQLHPEEREAMYMCGGAVDKDDNGNPEYVRAYVSIGDMVTIESKVNIPNITSSWLRQQSDSKLTNLAA